MKSFDGSRPLDIYMSSFLLLGLRFKKKKKPSRIHRLSSLSILLFLFFFLFLLFRAVPMEYGGSQARDQI